MQLILIATSILFAIRDYQHGEPGKNTIETGIQGNAWLDSYSISSEEGGYAGGDDESFIAPDERMGLLGGIGGRMRKGKGSLSRFLGVGLREHLQRYGSDEWAVDDEDADEGEYRNKSPFGGKDPFTK